MLHKHGRGGTVEVDGSKYDWELLSDPQLSSFDGWKGMTVSLRQHGIAREAVLEFPAPKRLLKGLPKGRLHINDTIASRGVRAALTAGWNPISRGKPIVFMVDANGNQSHLPARTEHSAIGHNPEELPGRAAPIVPLQQLCSVARSGHSFRLAW